MSWQEQVERGLLLVEADPRHDLRVGFRCRLLLAFDDPPRNRHIGRRARAHLAALSIRKVLPLWESTFPSDRLPHEALELAEKVLADTEPAPAAKRFIGKSWTHCDELVYRFAEKQPAIMVGYGAVKMVNEALTPDFDCSQIREEMADLDVDPYEHDSSFFASVAYCGGPSWEECSNAQKRLEFWTWWLTYAVGSAVQAAKP